MFFGGFITLGVVVLTLSLLISFFIMLYFKGHRHAYRVTRYRVFLMIYFGKHLRSYAKRFLKIVIDDYRIKRRKARNHERSHNAFRNNSQKSLSGNRELKKPPL